MGLWSWFPHAIVEDRVRQPAMPDNEASLCVLGTLEQIPHVRHWLEGILERWHVPPLITQDLALATTEVCTNIARHGYKKSPHGTIVIEITKTGERIQVSVTDTAPVFHPPPSVALPSPEPHEGGYGMYLTRTVVDEFHHFPLEPQGNRIILAKSTSSPPAHGGGC